MIEIFKQGESVILNVPIIDGGNAVDMSEALNIRAYLRIGNADYASYSLNSEPSFDGLLTVTGLADNIVTIPVERETSKIFPVGSLQVVVLVTFADVNFGTGEKTIEYSVIAANVRDGLAKDKTP